MTLDFQKTKGHQKQKEMFGRAVERRLLPHAFVFSGEEGIGKTTFALELATLLGAHPVLDVAFFDEGTLSIEQARALQSQLSLTPAGAIKAAIVTQAELMSEQAANSLLKTLEEPPPHSYLFLVTANYYGLLPTIRSRVVRINFSPAGAPPKAETEDKTEFLNLAKKYYDVMESGNTVLRLQTSAELAGKETPWITDFLKTAMKLWVTSGRDRFIGTKLLTAWRDLHANVNTKLLLDNLFI